MHWDLFILKRISDILASSIEEEINVYYPEQYMELVLIQPLKSHLFSILERALHLRKLEYIE